MTQSPINLSIVPPCALIVCSIMAKQSFMMSVTSSGESFSERAVKPAMSANITVASLFSDSGEWESDTGATSFNCPRGHWSQLARSGLGERLHCVARLPSSAKAIA